MTIPLSRHVGGREHAAEPQETTGIAERAPGAPPPLPEATTSASETAPRLSDEASTAPTLRPPPAPAQPALGAAASQPAEDLGERPGLGFTSVVRHLSLRGWLRWIYANRSHATLRVRTRDLGSGNIWCIDGRIVDAEWGQRTAEDALQEMLGLASGAVTIDFDPIDRPRRIAKPMRELLFATPSGSAVADISPVADIGSVADIAPHDVTLAASATRARRDQPFRNSAFIQLGKEAQAVLANARRSRPGARRAWPRAWARAWPRAWARARRISRATYVSGGLLLAAAVLMAFAFGLLRGPSESDRALTEPKQVQQTKALLPPPSPVEVQPRAPSVTPAPPDLPVIPFVALEIEPGDAEIWLDQSLVGRGRLELAAIPDGTMHELRFVAAGYETRNLYFVGTPPAGRVRLERAADRAPRAPATEQSPPERSPHSASAEESPEVAVVGDKDGVEGARLKSWTRHRAPVAPPPTRARNPAEGSAPAAKAARSKTSPQIQLIEARTPRVQVLD